MTRQVVLDTETTGLEPEQGHRVIEIGCVELLDRRLTRNNFHRHFNPERKIDAGAVDVHGITDRFLADKPRFGEVYEELLEYLRGAELIIHNAPFDVGFLNRELARVEGVKARIDEYCEVLDSLQLARRLHPGQKNSLDALCKRYGIDNSQRIHHGALLDAEILADVYLAMTGGQTSLRLDFDNPSARVAVAASSDRAPRERARRERFGVSPVRVAAEDESAHREWLSRLGEKAVWRD